MKVYLPLPYPENKPDKSGRYFVISDISRVGIDTEEVSKFNGKSFGNPYVTHYLIEADRVVLTESSLDFEIKLEDVLNHVMKKVKCDHCQQDNIRSHMNMFLEDYFKDQNI